MVVVKCSLNLLTMEEKGVYPSYTLLHIKERLAARYLLEAVLRRPKKGFSSALQYMFKEKYKLFFDTFMRRSEIAADGYIQQGTVNYLLEEYLSGMRDHENRL